MSSYLKLVAENPEKYPARMGQPWTVKETTDMLDAIENGKLLKDIAILHERTVGGIKGQLCKIAADLHFKNKASLEDIMTVTSLSPGEIENAIFTREEKMNEKDMRKKKADVGDLMREIGEIKKLLIELVEFKNKCIKKPVPHQSVSISL
jgi:argonaute-like protein implicated in RNA metabolism and viral defense